MPSSLRRGPQESPVAFRVVLERRHCSERAGHELEWGSKEDEEGDGGGSSSPLLKRWEVWRKRKSDFSFLGATRGRKWWIDGDENPLQRGDEVFVRAVFVDGGREPVASAGRVEVASEVEVSRKN